MMVHGNELCFSLLCIADEAVQAPGASTLGRFRLAYQPVCLPSDFFRYQVHVSAIGDGRLSNSPASDMLFCTSVHAPPNAFGDEDPCSTGTVSQSFQAFSTADSSVAKLLKIRC